MKSQHEPPEFAGKKFFVVRGCMRSGTNWVARVLNLHPQVSCRGEFHWEKLASALIENFENLEQCGERSPLRHKIWQQLDVFIKSCLLLANRPDAVWIGDRTPAYIEPTVVQGSQIFHVLRDGRDVLISRVYHCFNRPDTFPRFLNDPIMARQVRRFRRDSQYFIDRPHRLLDCTRFVFESASYWAKAVEHDLAALQKLDPSRWIEVRYEDLHRDVRSVQKRMYEFLDVDPALADALGPSTKPGAAVENPTGLFRKGIVGDWKIYMTRKAKAAFNRAAGETLVKLGYSESPQW